MSAPESMLQFIGTQPIAPLDRLQPRAECPACATATRFSLTTSPLPSARREGVKTFVAGYACDACLAPIAIEWTINSWPDDGPPLVRDPRPLTPLGAAFDREGLPPEVDAPLAEAAACWNAGAYNAFAWMCFRAIEAMGDDALGAGSPARVRARIDDAMEVLGLPDGWRSLVRRVLVPPDDRPRPSLPALNRERATVLLSVVRDLVDELYARPRRLKESVRGCRVLQRDGRREQRERDRERGVEELPGPLVRVR